MEYLQYIILSLIVLEPSHYLHNDKKALKIFSTNYQNAANEFYLDPILILSQNFFESDFKTSVIGDDNEIGLSQALGPWRKLCENKKYKLNTIEGGIYCTAFLLRRELNRCKTEQGAITSYISGKCKININDKKRFKKIKRAKYRYNYYQYLKKKFVAPVYKYGVSCLKH